MTIFDTDAAPAVYLNMAGAGHVSNTVLAQIAMYQKLEQRIGSYEAEEVYYDILQVRAYDTLSRLIGCNSVDIAIFDNATRAWIEVIRRLRLEEAGIIITTPYEYAGNLQVLRMLADRHGHTISTIPLTNEQTLDLDWLKAEMSERVKLVSIVHIPSNCGIINPVEAVGEIVSSYPAVYIVDACQSVGQREIDVKKIGCDVLTGAGRKFLSGPRGTGFAYVSSDLRKRMWQGFVDLHQSKFLLNGDLETSLATARFLELAERNCGAIVGLELAVREVSAASLDFAAFDELRSVVSAMPGVEVIDPGEERGCIFSFRHEDIRAADLVNRLRGNGVHAWRIQGAHTPIFMLHRGYTEAVRLSSSYLSEVEANTAIEAIRSALRK